MGLTTAEALSAIHLRNKLIPVILMEHPAVFGKPQGERNEGLLIDNLLLCHITAVISVRRIGVRHCSE